VRYNAFNILIYFRNAAHRAQRRYRRVSPERNPVKLAFQDVDTDTDTDTSIHPYVRYARFPREDRRDEIACVGRKTVAVFGESVSVSVSAPWNASLRNDTEFDAGNGNLIAADDVKPEALLIVKFRQRDRPFSRCQTHKSHYCVVENEISRSETICPPDGSSTGAYRRYSHLANASKAALLIRALPVASHAEQWVRLSAWGFLLVFYNNHSPKMDCF